MRNRRIGDRLLMLVTGACAATAMAVLVGIVGAILVRGLPSVDWSFLTDEIRSAGASGGIFYNVMGTLILITTAAVVTSPLAVGVALVQGVYLPPGRWRRGLALMLYLLNGTPAIVFGIVGMIVFVRYFGWGKSWLAGGLLLGLMILPTVAVALLERIRVLPDHYVDAARALGLSRAQTVRAVILPQALGGLFTGLLLGLARAAGETAPILFTATIFAGATLPSGVRESPVLSLPYHLFILAQDSYDPSAAGKVWATAVVLLALVMLLSILALPARLRVHEEARHG